MTKEDLDNMFGEGRWAACPTFAVNQYDKRKDTRRGFQNFASNFSEKLTLCNALQPAQGFPYHGVLCRKLRH